MNLDPIDFFPGHDPYLCLERRRSVEASHSNFWQHFIVVILTILLCLASLYYFEVLDENFVEKLKNPTYTSKEINCIRVEQLNEIQKELKNLKSKILKTDIWRRQLDHMYSKILLLKETEIENKVSEALDMYDSDKTGLFDYAAMYASGSIVSTPDTLPYPVNKTINILSLIKINVLSNPESLLQPNNLPGNCFAFYGREGKIRIRLGKKIPIKAVTMDHIKLYEDRSSAPRDFQVYGLLSPDAESKNLLGTFTYRITGRTYQTFKINSNDSNLFEYVELRVLNNYGRDDFTCIYRFRVHAHFIYRN